MLYKKHAVSLLAIAYNKTGNRENAKELVQESFINLYNHKEAIQENTSIRAYLYVILKNKIINLYHQAELHEKYTAYVVNRQPPLSFSPLAYVETRELERILRAEIEKLPPQCQLVFKLSREQYLSDKEIATELDISVNTVEQHKRKALRLLRTSLGGFLEISAIIYLLGK
jgi:RNA polymerase sigma-70 factor (family 1)